MTNRHTFCLRLRQARERAGLTVKAIGDASKIQTSLLVELERGDVSRWPKGIFRRAFFRAYAEAIGVPTEPMLNEFLRLFPEDGTVVEAAFPVSDEGGLRMTLAQGRKWWFAPTRRRVWVALADAGLIVLAALAVERLTPVNFWPVVGVVALIYYPIATAFTGQTVASLWLNGRSGRMQPPHALDAVAVDGAPIEGPRLVFRRLDERSTTQEPGATGDEPPHHSLRTGSQG